MRQSVGLTAHDMSDMGRLAHLAANPQNGASREEIYLAVASLYRIQGTGLNARERELMREILRRLTRDVEMAIRIALAQRLVDDTNAPHDLILMLVDDAIEVARPLILKSPLLTETDVLRLIAEASVAHQEAVAGRPHIGEQVTAALVNKTESVLVALVRNATAKISTASYQTLVEKSRVIATLQEPLAQRTDLPPELATRMCDWVSDTLKSFITTNYKAEPAPVESGIEHAKTVVKSPPPAPKPTPEESAQKLVEKLAMSGQLKAGFLMRVLSQGQIDLFDLGFARLLGMTLKDFRHVFYEGGPRIVALACRAASIDRAVFATVFNLSRQARDLYPSLTRADQTEVEQVFVNYTRPSAILELQVARVR